MKKPKVPYPEWMSQYPVEFWNEKKVIEYVKLAHEYLSTMRVKGESHQDFKDFCRSRDT